MDCSSKLESFCFSHLEDELHSTFAKSRHCDTSVYVENEELFQTLDAHCEQSISGDGCASPIVIAGEPGSGKSAFLSNWTDRRRSSAPPTRSLEYDEFVFWHAIGCSRLSTQVSHLLRRLVNSLTKHFELKEVMDLADDKLPWVLPRILERAAKKGRVVIVIDGGLQHICSKDEDLGLRWLPLRLPPNVRMIISVMLPTVHGNLSRNSDYATMLHAKTQHTWDEIQRRRWPIVLIERMDSGNVTSVIEKFHTMGTKEISLSEKRNLKECISLHPMAGNPFFLTYILRAIYHANELKYDMQQCLRRWASSKVKSSSYLIEQILATFESGFVKNETLGSEMGRNGAYILGPMLGHSLSLLFVARHGLHENELFELLGYVQEKSKWIDKTSGTVVPVKLKIVKMLMQKKKRLIDVFRSFDTDVSCIKIEISL